MAPVLHLTNPRSFCWHLKVCKTQGRGGTDIKRCNKEFHHHRPRKDTLNQNSQNGPLSQQHSTINLPGLSIPTHLAEQHYPSLAPGDVAKPMGPSRYLNSRAVSACVPHSSADTVAPSCSKNDRHPFVAGPESRGR